MLTLAFAHGLPLHPMLLTTSRKKSPTRSSLEVSATTTLKKRAQRLLRDHEPWSLSIGVVLRTLLAATRYYFVRYLVQSLTCVSIVPACEGRTENQRHPPK